jgi:hypothetical protein
MSSQPLKLIDLLSKINPDQSGYLKFKPTISDLRSGITLYLGIINGRIVYSGDRPFNIEDLFAIVRRYTIQTHNPTNSTVIDRILKDSSKQSKPLDKINQLIQSHIIDETHLFRALRSKILRDLDIYLNRSGTEEFMPDSSLSVHLPIRGCGIKSLLEASTRRIKSWQSFEPLLALDDIVTLKQDFISPKYLPLGQRDSIVDLIKSRETIGNILSRIARDDLEGMFLFIEMLKDDIIAAPVKESTKRRVASLRPILAIDSSETVLARIYALIDELGYPMMRCNDMDLAVDILRQKQPLLVLIETKMLSFGEQNLRQVIRETPNLANVPIAVMSSQGQPLSRLTAQSYYEVQKPADFNSEQGSTRFKDQISGILERVSRS